MKRNFELVRELLLAFEERDSKASQNIAPKGYSSEDISYHVELLIDKGFVTYDVHELANAKVAKQLTWEGHEFLDSIRDFSHWSKIKKHIQDKSLSLTFETIKATVTSLVKSALG